MDDKRPYSDEAATRVIGRVGKGEAVRFICEDPDMPSMLTLKRWRKENSKFRARWKEAMAGKRERAAVQHE